MEALGKPLDASNGDLRLTLNYVHPASSPESDFLFGRPFNGRSQKRRRKRTMVDVGEPSTHREPEVYHTNDSGVLSPIFHLESRFAQHGAEAHR